LTEPSGRWVADTHSFWLLDPQPYESGVGVPANKIGALFDAQGYTAFQNNAGKCGRPSGDLLEWAILQ
jgi:hypothetical protein